MVIIYTKADNQGRYSPAPLDNTRISRDYTTTREFLRSGLPSGFYGQTIRLQVFYGQCIYRRPDKVLYVTT
jgi:hypothetical protein